MYIFFTVFGFFFIVVFAVIGNYLYEMFPINRFTNLIKFSYKSTWGEISVTTFPIIIWSFIEIPIFFDNSNFALSMILNLFVSWAILYVIRYGAMLLKFENNIVNILSILIATLFGQFVSYMSLYSGTFVATNIVYSIIGLLIVTVFFVLVSMFPPKTTFFRGK